MLCVGDSFACVGRALSCFLNKPVAAREVDCDKLTDVPAACKARSRAAVKQLSVGGQSFDDRKFLDDSLELRARSTSHMRVWGFDVSAAVLYVPEDARVERGEDVMNPNLAKALEVRYMKGISGDNFRFVTRDTIVGNGFKGEVVDAGLEKFNPMYRDVAFGDAYCISYVPGDAGDGCVSLSFNGTSLGSVSGNEFSKAIFSVWFGDYVWFAQIKDDLLSGARVE